MSTEHKPPASHVLAEKSTPVELEKWINRFDMSPGRQEMFSPLGPIAWIDTGRSLTRPSRPTFVGGIGVVPREIIAVTQEHTVVVVGAGRGTLSRGYCILGPLT